MKYDPIVQLQHLIRIDSEAQFILYKVFGDLKFKVGSMKNMDKAALVNDASGNKGYLRVIMCTIDDERIEGEVYLFFKLLPARELFILKCISYDNELGVLFFDNFNSRTDEDGDVVLDYRCSAYDKEAEETLSKLYRPELNLIPIPENYEEFGIVPDYCKKEDEYFSPVEESAIIEEYEDFMYELFDSNNTSRNRK